MIFLGAALVVVVSIALVIFPGPVQRWLWQTWECFERLRAASGVRRAGPLLWQILLLPPRVRDRVDDHGLAPLYVARWWRALPLAMPIKALRFILLLVALAYVGRIADWDHLRLTVDPGANPGVVQALISRVMAVPMSVRAWGLGAIGKVALLLALTLVFVAEVRLVKRTNLTGHDSSTRYAGYDLESLDGYPAKMSPRMEYQRCWPVVALLTVAAQCGNVLRRWEETQPDCQIPRVSVQPVEQVIWKAHRTRRARARRHNERQFKAHAALVVGALRRAEAQKDSAPGRALEDLIVMLLTIAERYAEGRIDDLLDAEQLDGVDPATPRERLRLGVVGLVIVLAMTGAAVLGLPEAALVPLLPVVVVLVAVVFNRSRIPPAGQLTDLIIPR
ncbi:hypothetical protein ABZY93_15530 [Streptomyces smyrnaeus]|uniref:hypothetical protein n=1 Tax=Streptomyces smyrnaeus TaxID=1387713 RepID=UPI0033BB411C